MRKLLLFSVLLITCLAASAQQDLSGLKIFINPGHGGYDSDDRNVVIYPFKQGDPNGFWESVANLDKGFYLRDYLEAQGAVVYMSRVTNTSADDLPLSTIGEMANANNVDLFYSIHSNAHNGMTNYTLMLFRGTDDKPDFPESKIASDINWENFYANGITTWTYHNKNSRGDYSFYNGAMQLGVLKKLAVTGFLSEGSFHDYIPETYRLMSPMYKKHESWMFMKTVYDYFQKGEMKTGGIAGDIRDSRNKLQENYYIISGRDEFVPIHNAKITLLPNNITVQTDTLYNGVYFFDLLAPGNYQLKIEAEDYYPKTIDVVVKNHKITYENITLDKVRSTPPEITNFSPVSDDNKLVTCASPIILDFNWDMDEESTTNAFSITPNIEGTFSFENNNFRLVFRPNRPLDISTEYTIKLEKTAKHRGDMPMKEDFTYSFMTTDRNRLEILAMFPTPDDKHVFTDGEFRFVFDKQIKATSTNLNTIQVLDKDNNVLAKSSRNTTTNSVSAPYGSIFFKLTKALTENEDFQVIIDSATCDIDDIPVFETIKYNFSTNVRRVTDQTIADNFEGSASYLYQADLSEGVSRASTSRSTSTKLFDTSSHSLTYTFSDLEGSAVYKIAEPTTQVTKDKVMGLHIYGDFSANDLYLLFVDDNSVEYEAKIKTLDFLGWKFAEVKLENLPTDKTVKFSGFKVKGTNSIITKTGTVYLDNLLVYDGFISLEEQESDSDIRIYPNPASDFVVVNLINQNELIALDLYTLDGKRVKSSETSELIVSDVSAGTYILQVITTRGAKGYPIMIVR